MAAIRALDLALMDEITLPPPAPARYHPIARAANTGQIWRDK